MSAAAERGLFAAKGHARAAGASPVSRDDAVGTDAAAPLGAAEEVEQPALPLADLPTGGERSHASEHQPGSLLTFRLRAAPGSSALTAEIVTALAQPAAAVEPAPPSDATGDAAAPAAQAETAPAAVAAPPVPAAGTAGPEPARATPAPAVSGGRIDRPLFPPVRVEAKPVAPSPSAPARLSPLRTIVPAAAAVAAIAVVGWLVTQTGTPRIEDAAVAASSTAPATHTGNERAATPLAETAGLAPDAPEETPIAAAPAVLPEQPASPSAEPAPPATAAALVAPEPPQPVVPDPAPVPALPSLDLVRAEPGAPPVIAGRALPGSELIVLDNGMPLGEATADVNGDWAMVGEAPLPAGRHEFTLALKTPDGPLVVEQADTDLAALTDDQTGLPVPAQKPVPGTVAQGYVVQLASVPSAADATREWARLQAAHPALLGEREATIDEAEIGGRGTFYRLRTGPFAERGEARALCGELNGAGQDCLVIRGSEGN